jgi:hypothetical protein
VRRFGLRTAGKPHKQAIYRAGSCVVDCVVRSVGPVEAPVGWAGIRPTTRGALGAAGLGLRHPPARLGLLSEWVKNKGTTSTFGAQGSLFQKQKS